VLGEVLHESNLIFDFFIASYDSTKANKANHDSAVFKGGSVTNIEGIIREPRSRNRRAARAMPGSKFAAKFSGNLKQILYPHLKDPI
jgi:hypothetical protein